jgi:hypothetical protein
MLTWDRPSPALWCSSPSDGVSDTQHCSSLVQPLLELRRIDETDRHPDDERRVGIIRWLHLSPLYVADRERQRLFRPETEAPAGRHRNADARMTPLGS